MAAAVAWLPRSEKGRETYNAGRCPPRSGGRLSCGSPTPAAALSAACDVPGPIPVPSVLTPGQGCGKCVHARPHARTYKLTCSAPSIRHPPTPPPSPPTSSPPPRAIHPLVHHLLGLCVQLGLQPCHLLLGLLGSPLGPVARHLGLVARGLRGPGQPASQHKAEGANWLSYYMHSREMANAWPGSNRVGNNLLNSSQRSG